MNRQKQIAEALIAQMNQKPLTDAEANEKMSRAIRKKTKK